MGRTVRLRLGLLCALLAACAAPARAERIASFDVDVFLHREDRFSVSERIVWDFETRDNAHGIYREIPLAYGRGRAADYHVGIDVQGVSDGDGNPRPYRVTRTRGRLEIRIGDADRTVSGQQTYRIDYVVRRGLLFFDTHDEIYWNTTGNGWRVPIDRATTKVFLPEAVEAKLRARCYTGRLGSFDSECSHHQSEAAVWFETDGPLRARHGLSVVVALPKGLIEEPGFLARLAGRVLDYLSGWLLLPAAALAAMIWLWRASGRDPAGRAAIPVRYDPPEGLSPAEVGVVLDERADLRDLTATILDLAVRGHLRIQEIETRQFLFLKNEDYVLHRLRTPGLDGRRGYEKLLMTYLFRGASEVRVSALRDSFYVNLPKVRRALYRAVSREDGLFPVSPDRVRRFWAGVGGAAFAGSVALYFLGLHLEPILAVGATGAIVMTFSKAMPRRTRRGMRAYEDARGFQEYVMRVDADRLEREGTRTAERFEQVLPYAMVFGGADAWARAFEGIYKEPPSWYVGRYDGPFRTRRLVNHLGRSLSTMAESLSSQPRSSGSGSSGFSSGGGFSGGGFGGGGGGSW